jgi:purine nucleoside permease
MSAEEDLGGMDELAEESVRAADESLVEVERVVLKRTTTDLERFRSKIPDQPSFDLFMTAVAESNRRNESAAELKTRLEKLGDGAVKVAAKVAELASKGIV